MKRSIIVLALVATSFGAVSAQNNSRGNNENRQVQQDRDMDRDKTSKQDRVQSNTSGNSQQKAQEMTNKLDEVLSLTAEQRKKATAANLRYLDAM